MNKCPFCGLPSALFSHFVFFVLVISLLKMAPSTGLKCCLVFLSIRRLWCTLQSKCVLYKLCSGMTYSAVGREFKVNESTLYINKVPLNRNTHKTSFCFYQVMKVLWSEACRNLTLYFSIVAMAQYSLIPCLWQHHRTELSWIMKSDCRWLIDR